MASSTDAVAKGYELFERQRRSALAPSAAEPDYEDEWDDMTLAERKPFVEAALAANKASAAASPKAAADSSRAPKRAAPGGSSGGGASSGAVRKSKRPKTAFELWKREQPPQPDGSDDETPDLGALTDRQLENILKLVGDDPSAGAGRSDLMHRAGAAISRVGACKWRRAEQEWGLRSAWKAMAPEGRMPYEQRAAAAKEEYEGGEEKKKQPPAKKRPAAADSPGTSALASNGTPLPAKQRLKLAAASASRDGANAESSDKKKGGKATVGGGGKARGGGAGAERPMTEEPCPEFGAGWMRQSRERVNGDVPTKHVDHSYMSPTGESFNSRLKVLRHLNLETDPNPIYAAKNKPISEEERRRRDAKKSVAQLMREEVRRKQKEGKARAAEVLARAKLVRKERLVLTKERIAAALKESAAVAEVDPAAAAAELAPSCERPEPPGKLKLEQPDLASEVMGAWAFASAFASRLALSPFSVDDFVAALRRPGHGSILAELHVRRITTSRASRIQSTLT